MSRFRIKGPIRPHLPCIIVSWLCGLVLLALVVAAESVDVPDQIIRGLVAVESGAQWRGIGDIVGSWKVGKSGEISHFQISFPALMEMGAEHKADRIASSPVLAESFARLWLSRCFERHGNWMDALARYNAGNRYRSPAARAYAARVLNLAASF